MWMTSLKPPKKPFVFRSKTERNYASPLLILGLKSLLIYSLHMAGKNTSQNVAYMHILILLQPQ